MQIQQPESLYDAIPCPECGGREFRQESTTWEKITVSDDGESFGMGPVLEMKAVNRLTCRECDTVVWEADDENQL